MCEAVFKCGMDLANRKCSFCSGCILWILFALSLLITLATGATPLPAENSSTVPVPVSVSVPVSTPRAVEEFPKLPLAIHYEALCPDSMYFIRRRLHDALTDNNWWNRTELKLYPFGKANFYNNTALKQMEVYCQHGNEECELNALHACVLEHLELEKAFKLIYCMLRFYHNNIDECAKRLSLDVNAAKECKNSRKTPEILGPYGKETLALEISFVPSIVFDNQFQPYEQSSIRYNFESHFCRNYERKFGIKLPTCV